MARIPPGRSGKIRRMDLHDRHVGFWIGGDDLPFVLAAIRQDHFYIDGIGDHMIIRDDVAVRRNDHARPLSVLPTGRRLFEQTERQGFVTEGLITHHNG